MTTRIGFQQEMETLNEQLARMGKMIEDAIEESFRAMAEDDKEAAKKIVGNDRKINDMERTIESHCLSLILRQQPVVAGDLRVVSAALKVVTDMERIGDHAADIAELVLRMKDTVFYKKISCIPEMAEKAKQMVHDAVMAFIENDVRKAEDTARADDEVDELFNQVKQEIVKHLKCDASYVDDCVDIMMLAKYLERIADHAVNICEWAEFHETGEMKHIRLV